LQRLGVTVRVLSVERKARTDEVLATRLEAAGIDIKRVVLAGSRLRKIRAVHAVFKDVPRSEILHCNSDRFSGLLFPFATQRGIRVRILHARTPQWQSRHVRPLDRFEARLSWWLARRNCTHAFGVTQQALDAMLPSDEARGIPRYVVPSAISSKRFTHLISVDGRKPGGRDVTQLVLGYIGRIEPSKNPAFLIEILAVLRARGVNARLVFMGAGSEEEKVRNLVALKGLTDQVVLLPPSGDVAQVLAEQVGVFLLPSDHEGTPRVVVEAQATAVPVLCSSAVSMDVCVVPELFQRLALSAGAGAWADEALRLGQVSVTRQRVEDCFSRSSLEIENQATRLLELYRSFSLA
jgi:glycosyltransferase involved in cell wall biosynthesis